MLGIEMGETMSLFLAGRRDEAPRQCGRVEVEGRHRRVALPGRHRQGDHRRRLRRPRPCHGRTLRSTAAATSGGVVGPRRRIPDRLRTARRNAWRNRPLGRASEYGAFGIAVPDIDRHRVRTHHPWTGRKPVRRGREGAANEAPPRVRTGAARCTDATSSSGGSRGPLRRPESARRAPSPRSPFRLAPRSREDLAHSDSADSHANGVVGERERCSQIRRGGRRPGPWRPRRVRRGCRRRRAVASTVCEPAPLR